MNHIRFRAVIDSREGFEHNGNAWCVRWNKVTVTVAETYVDALHEAQRVCDAAPRHARNPRVEAFRQTWELF